MLVKGLQCGPFEEPVHHVVYFLLCPPPSISHSTLCLMFVGHFVQQQKKKQQRTRARAFDEHTEIGLGLLRTHTCILENLLGEGQEKDRGKAWGGRENER